MYFTFIFLSLIHHAVNLLLGKTTLVIGDGDAARLSSRLVGGGDVQDTVGINVEGNFDLWDTTRSRGNARQLKLAEKVVVLGAGTLPFVHLNEHTRLVVGVGGEYFGLLRRDGGVTLDKSSHDTTSRLDTERKRGNIEEKKVLSLFRGVARKDGSLDGSTIGNGLVGVDALIGLLAAEEVGDKFDDTGDTGGTTDQDNFMDVRLVAFCITEDLLNRFKSATEKILAKFLETGTSEGGIEVDALEERVDFNRCLSSRRKGTFGTLASSA